MEAAKLSRSRPSPLSGVVSAAANGNDGVQLSDKLQIFKTDGFDPEKYVQSKCQTMSEKKPKCFLGSLFITLITLQFATDGFSDENQLEQGGFDPVYKGIKIAQKGGRGGIQHTTGTKKKSKRWMF